MTMPNDVNAASPEDTLGVETGEPSRTAGARAQIREVKDQVVDQAKSSLRQAKDSAGASLSQSRSQAADRIGGIASAVRSTGDHLRSEEQTGVANLADSLADQVDRLSDYLRDRDLNAIRNDVESFARRQPTVAIGLALALGLVGARFIKSSQRSRGSHGGRSSGRPAYGGDAFDSYEDDYERGNYGTGTGLSGGYGMGSQPGGGGYGGA